MITRKVRALKDMDFKNELISLYLVEGEVKTLPFKNIDDLAAVLSLGNFKLVLEEMEEVKDIPVLHPSKEENPKNELLEVLDLTGHLDKLKEEDVWTEVDAEGSENEVANTNRQRRGTGPFGRG